MKKANKLKNLVLAMGLPIWLSSCALMGPSYTKPEITTPNNWPSVGESSNLVESGVNLSDVSWWTRFNDPKLNQLIEEALANNNNIQQALGNIIVAQGKLQEVKMSWVPTINLGGSAGVGQTFGFNPGTGPVEALVPPNAIQNTSNFNFYNGGLVPSYTLNVFQQIKQAEVAKANLAAANYAKDAVRLTVISQVAGSYFTLLALNEQLKEQQQLIADLQQQVKFIQVEYQNGYAALTDVEQAQEKLEQANLQLPTINSNIVQAENALQVLVNNNPGQIINNAKFSQVKLNGIIPVNLPSSVLRHRPDIMQAEQQLKMANANIGVATSNFFPTVNLTTPVGGFNTNFANLFNPSGGFWTAQISAMMPILNLGLYGLIKEKKGNYYVAYYNYVQTVRSAFAQVDDNLANYENVKQSYAVALRLNNVAQSNYALNQKNYQLGYISYLDSLTSKVSVDNTALTTTQIKLQELQAIVNLYQSMAGGYNYQNTDKPKLFGDKHDA